MLSNTKLTLGVLFAVSLTVANVVATKVVTVGGFTVSAGFLGIGVAFLCSDLIAEIYGKKEARNVVNATIGGLVLAQLLIYIALWMQPAPFFEATDAFQTTLGGSATIILASLTTALVSQNLDVIIFHRLKDYTDGKYAWTRNIGSTTISQLLDTAMFTVLAFGILPLFIGGTLSPWSAIVSIIVGEYIVKVGVAVLDTPIFYAIRGFIGNKDKNKSTPFEAD